MTTTTFGGYIAAAFTVPSGITASVTTNSGGPTAVTAPAGDYTSIDAFLTAWVAALTAARPVTAGAWTITNTLANAGATPAITIAVTAGTFSISWTSTALRDLLGFAGNITTQTSVAGDGAVRGVWQPDSPLVTAGRSASAAPKTDVRRSKGPTGIVYTHIGNQRYEQKDLRWSSCPSHKIWRTDETVDNESLQQWLDDTQWGNGHAWFSVGSKCRILTHDGNIVGGEDNVDNWWLEGFDGIDQLATRVDSGWDGLWTCVIPSATSDGA